MIGYRHKVSETWLTTRRFFLTASDIKSLIADTKAVDKGRIKLPQARQYAAVYGSKLEIEPDPWSSGAMARGHIMESYAVDEYNRVTGMYMRHWDDKLIVGNQLGFSPDAMDSDPIQGTRFVVDALGINGPNMTTVDPPTRILEIKSYSSSKYAQCALADKLSLDERWQVATALAVIPGVDDADLMFFAPQCGSMVIFDYDREELEKEIETIFHIRDLWVEYRHMADEKMDSRSKRTKVTEKQVEIEYMLDSNQDLGGIVQFN